MLHAYHRHRVHPVHRSLVGPDLSVGDLTAGDLTPAAAEDLDGLDSVDGLDACDAYVVLVVDPETGAVDSYGPLTGPDAITEAERRRRDLDAGDLDDVEVRVVRHHVLPVHG